MVTTVPTNSKVKTMTTTISSTVADLPAPVAVKNQPIATVPTASQPVTIDYGSFASMVLKLIAPEAATALGVTAEFVLNEMPMGALISQFIGPKVISDYVSKGLTVAEGLLAGQSLIVVEPNFIESTAASLFHSAETDLAQFLGGVVNPTIAALVAKLPTSTTDPTAPAPSGTPPTSRGR